MLTERKPTEERKEGRIKRGWRVEGRIGPGQPIIQISSLIGFHRISMHFISIHLIKAAAAAAAAKDTIPYKDPFDIVAPWFRC